MSSDSIGFSASSTDLAAVADRLREATGVFVITGAGVSAESGIPVFRGPGGLWRTHRPEDLASPEGFRRDPKLVWEWYNERRRMAREAKPNPAHDVLARWDERYESFLLATQNVDGLHQRAGARRIAELHGCILRSRCVATGTVYPDGEVDTESVVPPPSPASPTALLRPDVVWYGEYLPMEPIHRIEAFLSGVEIQVAFIVGTSAHLPYIVSWAYQAQHAGAMLVEINPDPRFDDVADVVIQGSAGVVLTQLDDLARAKATGM